MRLIEANELRNGLQNLSYDDDWNQGITAEAYLKIVDAIENAPTVDAEPIRHGHWESHALSIKDVPTESCSECGEWSYGDCERYCPYCGAKMDETGEEE